MKKRHLLWIMFAALIADTGGRLHAEMPQQFRVWGSEANRFPPAVGWTEIQASARSATVPPTAEETRRGFALSTLDPFTPVSSHAAPSPFLRAGELRLVAARGQYESARMVLVAVEGIDDVQCKPGELRGAGGCIPADHLDVRVVRAVRVPVDAKAKTYRLEPFLLEKPCRTAVAKGNTLHVWLTLKVPESTPAGVYRGTLRVQAAEREAAELPMIVEVLPFALPPAPIETAMYFPAPPESDELLSKQLTDIREHGCNGIEPALAVEINSRDRDFGPDDVAATRARCKRLMDAQRHVFGPRSWPVTLEVGHQIAYYWDQKKNWFTFWPRSEKIEGDLLRAIDEVRAMAKAEGWPPLRVYAQDEAGAHNLLDEAAYYYRLIKQKRPDLATWTDIGGGIAMGIDEIGGLDSCVDVFSTNRFNPEIARMLIARKKPYGVYNGCGPTPAGARFFFGFYGAKTGASHVAQWCYHFGDGVFRGNGLRQEDEGYVYSAADGPLPSVMWEAVRAGIDDYRYVTLLRQRVAAARASGSADGARAADEATRTLCGLLEQIGWGFQALDSAERTAPPHPAALREWRGQVARQIVLMQAWAGVKQTDRGSLDTINPLDLVWPAPPSLALQYGPELLPQSDFENEMKPWRVEAWNGKGQGRLDDGEHHSGRRSVRIDVPASSGSQAVTVLDWPTWGDGGLKLTFSGGRTYEFSAWAKWQGRTAPPAMRIALPEGAAKMTKNGRDAPDAAGWCRLWTRCELASPAAAKYLAVWIQGAGIVWIDDLSLREIVSKGQDAAPDRDAVSVLERHDRRHGP